MNKIFQAVETPFLKKDLPEFRPGDLVRVYQRIQVLSQASKDKLKENQEKEERTQVFEGIVISRKHGKGINATFTVRAVLEGVGVERTFPLHSPLIEKIEVLDRRKARRAKLYYVRGKTDSYLRKKLKPQK